MTLSQRYNMIQHDFFPSRYISYYMKMEIYVCKAIFLLKEKVNTDWPSADDACLLKSAHVYRQHRYQIQQQFMMIKSISTFS